MRTVVLAMAGLAVVGAVWAGVRGARLLARGLRAADDPRGALSVIRGLRGLIIGICLACFAAGVLFRAPWLLIFAALWLLEEIWETGVLATILRDGAAEAPPPFVDAATPSG